MSDEWKRRVKEVFSKNKQAYVDSATHRKQSDLEAIVEWLTPTPAQKALDIATGGGHVSRALSPYCGIVFATDLTKDMLENTAYHLSSYKNIEYIIADAEGLPFIEKTFDIVTCRIAPHHFPSPDTFVMEVTRVLKETGKFLLIDNIAPEDKKLDQFYNHFEKKRDYSHVRALKISEWEQLFIKNGLSIKNSLTRKKRMPFQDWVSRTTDNEANQKEIESLFRQASPEAKCHFSICEENGQIQSFAIDEYMVLVEKIFLLTNNPPPHWENKRGIEFVCEVEINGYSRNGPCPIWNIARIPHHLCHNWCWSPCDDHHCGSLTFYKKRP
ncbi:Ubiquinone/menaquinone biosynthesis C-methylase UbiE [Halobacillus karajensis]|uniref:Methyltransferase YcgJ n=1 Tax=Halobacillus karajensis TaxID=195088 RepID=A0A024P971_9BACI|nr:class I SAM-dependent methyltransferase [Halobacillus karajensis]CDQ21463.1 putative methyltransferase YcgJ [Halobacillus karajensis]CDQ25398.1 putative methyltransferase YcgJ [Halobacillus karajensis]CDQ29722.1 putative methyltransferase YcgJ [Halobacillus karajensis]SEI07922.1 Ubiquinone/menaquinone biosynthesis C-methylase UbiE [Halobacillus karajensis]